MTIISRKFNDMSASDIYDVLQLRSEVFIMDEAIRVVEEEFGKVPIMIHAQSYAAGFYEKFGFRISSEEFLEEGILHHEMIREPSE